MQNVGKLGNIKPALVLVFSLFEEITIWGSFLCSAELLSILQGFTSLEITKVFIFKEIMHLSKSTA